MGMERLASTQHEAAIEPVIAIEWQDVLAPRLHDTGISGRWKAHVGLTQDAEVIGERVDESNRIRVVRAVVDEDRLEILEGLRTQAVERLPQVLVAIVAWHNHGDLRPAAFASLHLEKPFPEVATPAIQGEIRMASGTIPLSISCARVAVSQCGCF